MAVVGPDKYLQPMAQTFRIIEPFGVFLKKIEVFFTSKDDTLPITLDLRATQPAQNGAVNVPVFSRIIPGSSVTVNSASVQTSADASVATEFIFDEPIYLPGNAGYAFTLKTNAIGTYLVGASRVGDFALGSTQTRVTKDLNTGSLFRAQDGLSFSQDVDTDLKFILYRAKFSARSATAFFKAASPPQVLLENDPFSGAAGDSTVTVTHPDHGFQINDRVRISGLDAGTRYNGIRGSSINGRRIITNADGFGYQFEADSAADSDVSFGGSSVTATSNLLFNIGQIQFETYMPSDTELSFDGTFTTSKSFAGDETAYGTSNTIRIKNNVNFSVEDPHVVVNDSNEALHLSGNESTVIQANLASRTSDFTSPLIDLQRAQFLAISNKIDRQDSAASTGFNVPINFVPETDPANGSSLAKHITKPVNLTAAANGIKVLFASNRPVGTHIDLYYRTTLDGTDSDILQKPFVYVEDTNVPPNDENPTVFREHDYTIGGEFANELPTFNQYQIKLVMTSTSSSKVPRIIDLRTIALGAE